MVEKQKYLNGDAIQENDLRDVLETSSQNK